MKQVSHTISNNLGSPNGQLTDAPIVEACMRQLGTIRKESKTVTSSFVESGVWQDLINSPSIDMHNESYLPMRFFEQKIPQVLTYYLVGTNVQVRVRPSTTGQFLSWN